MVVNTFGGVAIAAAAARTGGVDRGETHVGVSRRPESTRNNSDVIISRRSGIKRTGGSGLCRARLVQFKRFAQFPVAPLHAESAEEGIIE